MEQTQLTQRRAQAAAAANELNMEVDEEGSSSALDAAAAAAELDVVRRKAAAVDALVRSGELPAEVRARARVKARQLDQRFGLWTMSTLPMAEYHCMCQVKMRDFSRHWRPVGVDSGRDDDSGQGDPIPDPDIEPTLT